MINRSGSPLKAAGMTVVAIVLSSCVPLPPDMVPKGPGGAAAAPMAYPDIDPGGTSYNSLHFSLRGYSETDLHNIANVAEDMYNKIGTDTGLYSYLAGQTFTIVVYKDSQEYTTKTKKPQGSRGTAADKAVYTYAGPELDLELAHQLSHMIFHSYMGEKASLQWLSEGLAMHEQVARMPEVQRVSYHTAQSNKLRNERIPFSQMTFFVGKSEDAGRDETWYWQVESVVSYLMKQGTSLTFAALLNQLRNGSDLEHAVADNYSGKFRNLADFESGWQVSL